MTFGVTATGFVPPTVEELLADIEADQRSLIAPDIDQSPDQPLGQLNGIQAKKLAEVGEGLATAYNGFNRGAAEGVLLDNIGSLTGTPRKDATKSKVSCTCNLDALAVLPAGSVINVYGQPSTRFASIAETTATGAGNYAVEFECEQTGPVVANSGTLTVIATPVAGWNSVTNALDASLGTNIETDAAYRLRQAQELEVPGSCTVDAIRADLLQLDGVIEAFVFENTSMATDGDGVPPKAFESVIWDGTGMDTLDSDIGDVIWQNKPSGIETYGSTTVTVQDSRGLDRDVKFSRATGVNVYLTYTLTVDATKYPVDGDDQVKAAAIAFGLSILSMGEDVVYSHFLGVPFAVEGVTDVALTLGTAPSPVGVSNIAISSRQIAVLDTSRIVVNS